MTADSDITLDIEAFITDWIAGHQDQWADRDSRKANALALDAALHAEFPQATRADIVAALRALAALRGRQLGWLH